MKSTVQLILLATAVGALLPLHAVHSQPAQSIPGTGATVDGTQPPAGTNVTENTVRRDPFWPVGYVPEVPQPVVTNAIPLPVEPVVVEKPKVTIVWPELHARGFTETPENEYIAFLDGIGMIEAGDVVQKERGGILFTWRVVRIAKGGAELRRESAEPKGNH